MKLPRLMIVLDGSVCEDVLHVAREACAAGGRFFQWRHKQATPREFYETGRTLAMIVASYNGVLVINDRLDVARALAAQGVHLPANGLPLRAVRSTVGRDRVVGVSCHDDEEVANTRGDASYITYSPVFEPNSPKPEGAVIRAVGVEGLAGAVRRSEAPVYALGGITPERVSACLEAGAHGVAVLGGINLAEDPFEATLAYLEALDA